MAIAPAVAQAGSGREVPVPTNSAKLACSRLNDFQAGNGSEFAGVEHGHDPAPMMSGGHFCPGGNSIPESLRKQTGS